MRHGKFTIIGNSCVALAGLVGLVSVTSADTPADKLSGCYNVETAAAHESAIDAKNVIGTYKMRLSKIGPIKDRLILSGPLKGSETDEGHVFGTKNRVGTFSTLGDSLTITSTGCFDSTGTPKSIKGVETFRFNKGTGIFSGMTSGTINFDLVFDACTDPGNPVADLHAKSGIICF